MLQRIPRCTVADDEYVLTVPDHLAQEAFDAPDYISKRFAFGKGFIQELQSRSLKFLDGAPGVCSVVALSQSSVLTSGQ